MDLREIVDLCFLCAIDRDMDVDEWASRAGLHPTTLQRLGTGETTQPRWLTVVRMAEAVGLRVVVATSKPSRRAS